MKMIKCKYCGTNMVDIGLYPIIKCPNDDCGKIAIDYYEKMFDKEDWEKRKTNPIKKRTVRNSDRTFPPFKKFDGKNYRLLACTYERRNAQNAVESAIAQGATVKVERETHDGKEVYFVYVRKEGSRRWGSDNDDEDARYKFAKERKTKRRSKKK
jgi:hypothetical protein